MKIYGCPCGNMSRPHINIGSHTVICLKCRRLSCPGMPVAWQSLEVWNQNVLDEINEGKTMFMLTASGCAVIADIPCIYKAGNQQLIDEKDLKDGEAGVTGPDPDTLRSQGKDCSCDGISGQDPDCKYHYGEYK